MRNERELYRLRVENIDWNRGMIFIPDSKSPVGRRSVPMSDRVTTILTRRCEDTRDAWIFPSRRSVCGHLTTISQTFRRARKKADLPRELVLYCGRHDYGTRILSMTGNLAVVMETMGHKDFQSAMKYQHPDLEIVRRALNRPV
jgi:integrase